MSWLDDIGSFLGDAASSVGNGVSDFVNNVFSSSPTAGTSDTLANTGQGGNTPATDLSSTGTGGAAGTGDFSVNPGLTNSLLNGASGATSPVSFASGFTPTASAASGANFSMPAANLPSSSAQNFLNPSSAVSDPLSYPGTGPNTDSVLSTANTNPQAAVTPTSTTDQISNALGLNKVGIGDILKAGIGAAGLGYTASKNQSSSTGEKDIKNAAATQSAQGQQLESYINNGTLPPGAQAWVDQQTAAQKAQIMSTYAANGMTGSTAEAQDLANVDANATAQMFQIANSLLQSGISETGASNQLYQVLMNAQNQDSQQVSTAIQNFVGALGGGTGSGKQAVTLNL